MLNLSRASFDAKIWGLSLAACILLARALSRRRKLPPLCPASLFTTISEMGGRGKPPAFLERMRREVGKPIFRLPFLQWDYFVVVADADVARTILNQQKSEKTWMYKSMNAIHDGHDNLFTKYTFNDGWDWARKGSAHAFTMARVNASMQQTAKHLDELDTYLLDCEARGLSVPVAEVMVHLTLDMIATSGFGGFPMDTLQIQGQERNSEGRKFLHELELGLVEFVVKQVYDNDPLRKFKVWNPELQRANQAGKFLMDQAHRILDVYRASGKLENDEDSLIGFLCRNENYPSDDERCCDVLAYLIAGHDTTGYTIAWILCELAKHPDIQEKLAADVKEHGKDSAYLQCVIKEGLRVNSVASLGSVRRNAEDVKTPDGTFIPAGSTIMTPMHLMLREPWIERAKEFVPERWAEGAPQKSLLESKIFPFSLGKRNCVGQRLALSSIKNLLLHLVPRYEFGMVKEPVADYFLTLKPAGAELSFTPRRTVDIVGA